MGLVLNTIITFVVSTLLGYCLNTIKNYRAKSKREKENENAQNEALLVLLQSDLTELYYKYEEKEKIPENRYKNWKNLLAIYEKLGGDDYIHDLNEKVKKWEIVKIDNI